MLVVCFVAQDFVWAYGSTSLTTGGLRTAPNVPSDLGLTRKSSLLTTDQGEMIINIQDAHSKLGAQESISKILDTLVKNYDLKMIALEGASSFVDTSIVSSFPIQKAKENVAGDLLKEGRISASEFYSMLTREKVSLYGVEDPSLYRQNVEVFKSLIEQKPKIRQELKNLKATLKALGDHIYSPKLKTLLNQRLLHQNGDIKFTEYWETFSKEAKAQGLELSNYPHLDKLSRTIDFENKIDFKSAALERDRLIEALGQKLKEAELKELILKSLEFKKNKIAPSVFHALLLERARQNSFNETSFPNLSLYTQYVSLYESIDLIQIFDEVESFEEALKNKLFENDTQRSLSKLQKSAAILSQLLDTTLTSKDYGFFIQNQPACEIEAIGQALQTLCETYKVLSVADFDYLKAQIPSAKQFYELAEARNKALLENTLKKMRENGQKIAALVTGGFHTEGLSQLMDQNKLSYLVVMPKFDEKSPDRPYFTILTQKPKEQEELFKEGEEFYVAAPVMFDTGSPEAPVSVKPVVRGLFAEGSALESKKDPRFFARRYLDQYGQKLKENPGQAPLLSSEALGKEVETIVPGADFSKSAAARLASSENAQAIKEMLKDVLFYEFVFGEKLEKKFLKTRKSFEEKEEFLNFLKQQTAFILSQDLPGLREEIGWLDSLFPVSIDPVFKDDFVWVLQDAVLQKLKNRGFFDQALNREQWDIFVKDSWNKVDFHPRHRSQILSVILLEDSISPENWPLSLDRLKTLEDERVLEAREESKEHTKKLMPDALKDTNLMEQARLTMPISERDFQEIVKETAKISLKEIHSKGVKVYDQIRFLQALLESKGPGALIEAEKSLRALEEYKSKLDKIVETADYEKESRNVSGVNVAVDTNGWIQSALSLIGMSKQSIETKLRAVPLGSQDSPRDLQEAIKRLAAALMRYYILHKLGKFSAEEVLDEHSFFVQGRTASQINYLARWQEEANKKNATPIPSADDVIAKEVFNDIRQAAEKTIPLVLKEQDKTKETLRLLREAMDPKNLNGGTVILGDVIRSAENGNLPDSNQEPHSSRGARLVGLLRESGGEFKHGARLSGQIDPVEESLRSEAYEIADKMTEVELWERGLDRENRESIDEGWPILQDLLKKIRTFIAKFSKEGPYAIYNDYYRAHPKEGSESILGFLEEQRDYFLELEENIEMQKNLEAISKAYTDFSQESAVIKNTISNQTKSTKDIKLEIDKLETEALKGVDKAFDSLLSKHIVEKNLLGRVSKIKKQIEWNDDKPFSKFSKIPSEIRDLRKFLEKPRTMKAKPSPIDSVEKLFNETKDVPEGSELETVMELRPVKIDYQASKEESGTPKIGGLLDNFTEISVVSSSQMSLVLKAKKKDSADSNDYFIKIGWPVIYGNENGHQVQEREILLREAVKRDPYLDDVIIRFLSVGQLDSKDVDFLHSLSQVKQKSVDEMRLDSLFEKGWNYIVTPQAPGDCLENYLQKKDAPKLQVMNVLREVSKTINEMNLRGFYQADLGRDEIFIFIDKSGLIKITIIDIGRSVEWDEDNQQEVISALGDGSFAAISDLKLQDAGKLHLQRKQDENLAIDGKLLEAVQEYPPFRDVLSLFKFVRDFSKIFPSDSQEAHFLRSSAFYLEFALTDFAHKVLSNQGKSPQKINIQQGVSSVLSPFIGYLERYSKDGLDESSDLKKEYTKFYLQAFLEILKQDIPLDQKDDLTRRFENLKNVILDDYYVNLGLNRPILLSELEDGFYKTYDPESKDHSLTTKKAIEEVEKLTFDRILSLLTKPAKPSLKLGFEDSAIPTRKMDKKEIALAGFKISLKTSSVPVSEKLELIAKHFKKIKEAELASGFETLLNEATKDLYGLEYLKSDENRVKPVPSDDDFVPDSSEDFSSFMTNSSTIPAIQPFTETSASEPMRSGSFDLGGVSKIFDEAESEVRATQKIQLSAKKTDKDLLNNKLLEFEKWLDSVLSADDSSGASTNLFKAFEEHLKIPLQKNTQLTDKQKLSATEEILNQLGQYAGNLSHKLQFGDWFQSEPKLAAAVIRVQQDIYLKFLLDRDELSSIHFDKKKSFIESIWNPIDFDENVRAGMLNWLDGEADGVSEEPLKRFEEVGKAYSEYLERLHVERSIEEIQHLLVHNKIFEDKDFETTKFKDVVEKIKEPFNVWGHSLSQSAILGLVHKMLEDLKVRVSHQTHPERITGKASFYLAFKLASGRMFKDAIELAKSSIVPNQTIQNFSSQPVVKKELQYQSSRQRDEDELTVAIADFDETTAYFEKQTNEKITEAAKRRFFVDLFKAELSDEQNIATIRQISGELYLHEDISNEQGFVERASALIKEASERQALASFDVRKLSQAGAQVIEGFEENRKIYEPRGSQRYDSSGHLLLPEFLVPAGITQGQELVEEVRDYVEKHMDEGHGKFWALKNLEDVRDYLNSRGRRDWKGWFTKNSERENISKALLAAMEEARKRNILLTIGREIKDGAEFRKIFKPYLTTLMGVFNKIPQELLWDSLYPMGWEVSKTEKGYLGWFDDRKTRGFGGGGITGFLLDEPSHRHYGRPERQEDTWRDIESVTTKNGKVDETSLLETVVHELLGHQRHNAKRLKYIFENGSLKIPKKLIEAWELVMSARDWQKAAELNGINELKIRESRSSLSNFPIADLHKYKPQEVLQILRDAAGEYYSQIQELVAYSVEGMDLTELKDAAGNPANPNHQLDLTRKALMESVGRVGVPVDPKNKVYVSYLYNRNKKGFQEYYLQDISRLGEPVWVEVKWERSQWVPSNEISSGQVQDVSSLEEKLKGLILDDIYDPSEGWAQRFFGEVPGIEKKFHVLVHETSSHNPNSAGLNPIKVKISGLPKEITEQFFSGFKNPTEPILDIAGLELDPQKGELKIAHYSKDGKRLEKLVPLTATIQATEEKEKLNLISKISNWLWDAWKDQKLDEANLSEALTNNSFSLDKTKPLLDSLSNNKSSSAEVAAILSGLPKEANLKWFESFFAALKKKAKEYEEQKQKQERESREAEESRLQLEQYRQKTQDYIQQINLKKALDFYEIISTFLSGQNEKYEPSLRIKASDFLEKFPIKKDISAADLKKIFQIATGSEMALQFSKGIGLEDAKKIAEVLTRKETNLELYPALKGQTLSQLENLITTLGRKNSLRLEQLSKPASKIKSTGKEISFERLKNILEGKQNTQRITLDPDEKATKDLKRAGVTSKDLEDKITQLGWDRHRLNGHLPKLSKILIDERSRAIGDMQKVYRLVGRKLEQKNSWFAGKTIRQIKEHIQWVEKEKMNRATPLEGRLSILGSEIVRLGIETALINREVMKMAGDILGNSSAKAVFDPRRSYQQNIAFVTGLDMNASRIKLINLWKKLIDDRYRQLELEDSQDSDVVLSSDFIGHVRSLGPVTSAPEVREDAIRVSKESLYYADIGNSILPRSEKFFGFSASKEPEEAETEPLKLGENGTFIYPDLEFFTKDEMKEAREIFSRIKGTLGPKHKFVVGKRSNKRIVYASDVFTTPELKERPGVVIYVVGPDGKLTHMRLAYRSISANSWRVVSHFVRESINGKKIDWFGKGRDERAMDLPIGIGVYLDSLNPVQNPKEAEDALWIPITIERNEAPVRVIQKDTEEAKIRKGEYEGYADTFIDDQFMENISSDTSVEDFFSSSSNHALSISEEAHEPDYKSGILRDKTQYDLALKTDKRTVIIGSKDRKYLYKFTHLPHAKQSDQVSWLSAVQLANANVTDYGVHERVIEQSGVAEPGLEYHKKLKDKTIRIFPGNTNYAYRTGYTHSLPLVKEFIEKVIEQDIPAPVTPKAFYESAQNTFALGEVVEYRASVDAQGYFHLTDMKEAHLVLTLTPEEIRQRIQDGKALTFGRYNEKSVLSNDILINDDSIEPKHAEISFHATSKEEIEVYIKDMGSNSGTFINSQRVRTNRLLFSVKKLGARLTGSETTLELQTALRVLAAQLSVDELPKGELSMKDKVFALQIGGFILEKVDPSYRVGVEKAARLTTPQTMVHGFDVWTKDSKLAYNLRIQNIDRKTHGRVKHVLLAEDFKGTKELFLALHPEAAIFDEILLGSVKDVAELQTTHAKLLGDQFIVLSGREGTLVLGRVDGAEGKKAMLLSLSQDAQTTIGMMEYAVNWMADPEETGGRIFKKEARAGIYSPPLASQEYLDTIEILRKFERVYQSAA